MKQISPIVLLLGLWPAIAAGMSGSEAEYENITAAELKQRIEDENDTEYVILDVRQKSRYETSHIPGAASIPLKELGRRLFELDRTKDIIVYCDTESTSSVACRVLLNAGFKDVYNLTGGLKGWSYAVQSNNGSVDI